MTFDQFESTRNIGGREWGGRVKCREGRGRREGGEGGGGGPVEKIDGKERKGGEV